MRGDLNLFWLVGAGVAGAWMAWHYFSRGARLRRRRRKSHSRLESTAQRPMVKFSVKPPKE